VSALSITAASVVGSWQETRIAGAAITAGQAIYLDSSSLVQKSDCDSASAAKTVYGVALNSAASGQPVAIQRTGNITIGATTTAGKIYVLDGGAGGICPVDDLTSGDTVVVIGVGISTTQIMLGILNSGTAL
jgi:hypothetical protein